MSDPVVDSILSAIETVKRLPRERIRLDSTLSELGLDSLDTLTMLFELEDRFRVSIPDEAARSVRTVRDMVEGIRALLPQATPGRVPAAE